MPTLTLYVDFTGTICQSTHNWPVMLCMPGILSTCVWYVRAIVTASHTSLSAKFRIVAELNCIPVNPLQNGISIVVEMLPSRRGS
jgi:hypothetical protein